MGAEASETGRWIRINGARLYCDDRGAGTGLPNAELAVCPHADHRGPITRERIAIFAGMIRDFAGRHGQAP